MHFCFDINMVYIINVSLQSSILRFSHNKFVPGLTTHTHHGGNTQTEPLTYTHIQVFLYPAPRNTLTAHVQRQENCVIPTLSVGVV